MRVVPSSPIRSTSSDWIPSPVPGLLARTPSWLSGRRCLAALEERPFPPPLTAMRVRNNDKEGRGDVAVLDPRQHDVPRYGGIDARG